LDWLEESVDLILDWPAKSPNLSPIELLRVILKKLIREIQSETMEELRSTLTAAWNLIPQSTVDGLCEGFERQLDVCLANGGESISS
jgi:hypothetical protein